MRRATAAQTVLTPVQHTSYREGSLGWFLIRYGWESVYIGRLAHPYWRRGNGPSMPASTAWTITLREMSQQIDKPMSQQAGK